MGLESQSSACIHQQSPGVLLAPPTHQGWTCQVTWVNGGTNSASLASVTMVSPSPQLSFHFSVASMNSFSLMVEHPPQAQSNGASPPQPGTKAVSPNGPFPLTGRLPQVVSYGNTQLKRQAVQIGKIPGHGRQGKEADLGFTGGSRCISHFPSCWSSVHCALLLRRHRVKAGTEGGEKQEPLLREPCSCPFTLRS